MQVDTTRKASRQLSPLKIISLLKHNASSRLEKKNGSLPRQSPVLHSFFKEEIHFLLFFIYLKMGVTYQSHLSRAEQLQHNKFEPFIMNNA